MPIIVKINPVRVEEVKIETSSEVVEDLFLSAWPVIRKHLKKLNVDLQKHAAEFLNTRCQVK